MIKIILSLFFVLPVFAEEAAHGGAEASKEAVALTPDQKSSKELMEVEKQVSTLAAKIKAKNDSINNLLTQKSTAKTDDKATELVKFVQQEHRELEKLTQEYNAQLGILQYRFPERGLKDTRRYQRINTKSLDEMEKILGLDAQLEKSRKKVKTVYGIKEPKKEETKGSGQKDLKADESILNPSTISK